MLTEIDIKTLPSYGWGRRDGKLEGIEQGLEKGIEQGKLKGLEAAAMNLLPMMNDNEIANITGLSIDHIQALRSLKASSDQQC